MSDDTVQTCPQRLSVRDLNEYRFEIPAYQRGFRWTWQQVGELIDDLYAFSKDASKSTYCLQNVTVRKKPNEVYEVIDGQQRLTAIWLLIMSYMDSRKYDEESVPVYSLTYEGKDGLTDYVEHITDHVRAHPSSVSLLDVDSPQDIDSAFIYAAFEYIIKEYKNGDNKYSTVLNAIFNDEFISDKKQISVIWNEIGAGDGGGTEYAIERFSNLNANKIPLTESELIKAHFIDRLASERAQEFSLQWEEMERGLNDDEFWGFLSSGKGEETRMDFLFRVHLMGNPKESTDGNERHVLSRRMSERLRDAKAAYEEWTQIVQIYDTLKDWYRDYYDYHVIGLIIAIEGADADSIVKSLYETYKKSSKKVFKELLKQRIRGERCFRIPFLSDNGGDWKVESPDDILLEGPDDKEISYVKNKAFVKPLLLLFNISLLLNAYSINSENAAERFSFKIYKSTKNPIEIEHINPQHLEGRKADGSEYTESEKKEWARKTVEVIVDPKKREGLLEEIKGTDDIKTLVEEIERAAELNVLSNLTLLDKNLNIRYGDNFFNEKRKHILAARFGNPVPHGDAVGYYEQSVIFPGTMWVFMRQYNRIGGDPNVEDRWNADDRRAYIRCMQESIYRFLRPADNGKGW